MELTTWNSYTKKWEKVELKPREIFDKSYTDTSKFRPNVNDLTGAVTTNNITGEYDFQNGETNANESMFMMRNKGADIVELTKYAEKEIARGNKIKDEIKEAYETELEKMKNEEVEKSTTTPTETNTNNE